MGRSLEIKPLTIEDMSTVGDAFMAAFHDNPYYTKMWPDVEDRTANMRNFEVGMEYCIEQNHSLGIYEGNRLIAFFITCNWHQLRKDEAMQEYILGQYYNPAIIKQFDEAGPRVQYCLLLAVDPEFKGQGLEQRLWESLMGQFIDYTFVGDVTDISTIRMYYKMGFRVFEVYPGYWTVIKS